ncbi:MAG: Hsp70 family protein [Treponema sp.]|nr:Hsp70 family protein [Treponema sp.]
MKQIGIKLADGTFYPILEEGTPKTRKLDLTTAKDNQTKVQIDVYRSESGTMEDAEYVDTLEVTKLQPHPNGEPELHLSVGIDENNELTAEVIDSETGKKSEIQVQLVNRTLAERENSNPDFTIENAVDETDLPFSFDTATVSDDPASPEPAADDFSIPDFTSLASPDASDEPKHTPVSADFDLPDLGDLNLDEPKDALTADDVLEKEPAASAESPADEPAASSEAPEGTLPTDDVLSEEPAGTDDNAAQEPAASELSAEEPVFEDTPASSEETVLDDSGTADFDLPDFDNLGLDEPKDTLTADDVAKESTLSADSTVSAEDSFIPTEIPQADTALDSLDDLAAETVEEPKSPFEPDTSSTESLNSFDLPDFSDLDTTTTATSSNSDEAPDLSDFDLPDFGSSDVNFHDNAFDDPIFADPAPATTSTAASAGMAPAMDFTDLYDKETLEGKASSNFTDYDDDETVHKTRVPVIICVVCAIICIIATALILFIIPSRYNLISSRKAKAQKQQTEIAAETKPDPVTALPQQEPVQKPEPVAPAVEDKIVIAPEPEIVVPEPVVEKAPEPKAEPAADAKAKAKGDVVYHIKWGDTLWDISAAYYKNPWRYPKIANYNNIKNPDLIISGTDITIPAE